MTEQDATRLKSLLWDGAHPVALVKTFRPKLALSTIYSTRNGNRWAGVKWPDGSTGALEKPRAEKIRRARETALEATRI